MQKDWRETLTVKTSGLTAEAPGVSRVFEFAEDRLTNTVVAIVPLKIIKKCSNEK